MTDKFTPTDKKLDDLGLRMESILEQQPRSEADLRLQIKSILEELFKFASLGTCAIPEEGLPKNEEDE